MKIETIRKNHKKSIIACVVAFVAIAIVLIMEKSFAKYELVKSIKIAEGTINYKVPDFKMMAMYKNDGNDYIEIETMPESGYTINESKTYCEVNGNKDSNAKIYTDENGQHIISNITKGSRCYLYFEIAPRDIKPEIITSAGGVAIDNDGNSYYFRGAVNNNYVKFAGFWWRIIRINGDGSIRIIYDGTSGHANGTSTTDSIAVTSRTFSQGGLSDNNAYVGFKYTVGQLRGTDSKSRILIELESWYRNNLSSYTSKIDSNAGFCGDRTPSTSMGTSNGTGGTGTTTTYYGAYIRLIANRAPLLTCANSSDLYTTSVSNKGNKSLTYPIGLISADEVSMAGGSTDASNYSYYLYNGQNYWTLSPYWYNHTYYNANVFIVGSDGMINRQYVGNMLGMRPVINILSDVTFTGTGTISDPYIAS